MITKITGKYTHVVETLIPLPIKENLLDDEEFKKRKVAAKAQLALDLHRIHPYLANLMPQQRHTFMDMPTTMNPDTYCQGDLNGGSLTSTLLSLRSFNDVATNQSDASYPFQFIEGKPPRTEVLIPFIDDAGIHCAFAITLMNVKEKRTEKVKTIYYTTVIKNTIGDANLRDTVAFYDDCIMPELTDLHPTYQKEITISDSDYDDMQQTLFASLNCKQLQRLIRPIFGSNKKINTAYCSFLENNISKIPDVLEPFVIKMGELWEMGAPEKLLNDLNKALSDLIKQDDEDDNCPINHLSQTKIKTFSDCVNSAISKYPKLMTKPKTKSILTAIQEEALIMRLHTVNPNPKLDDFKHQIQLLAQKVPMSLFISLCDLYQTLHTKHPLTPVDITNVSKKCLALIKNEKPKLVKPLTLATLNLEPYFSTSHTLDDYGRLDFEALVNAINLTGNDPYVLVNLRHYFLAKLSSEPAHGLIEKYVANLPLHHEFERILQHQDAPRNEKKQPLFLNSAYTYTILAPFMAQTKKISALIATMPDKNKKKANVQAFFDDLNLAYTQTTSKC